MINPFKIKKFAGLILPAFMSCLMFYLGLVYLQSYLWAVAAMMLGILISVPIGSKLLSNPFSRMVEGQGLLAMDLGSTGIIKLFTVQLDGNYIRGKLGNNIIEDTWDRNAVLQLAPPTAPEGIAKVIDGKLELPEQLIKALTEEDYHKSKFSLNTYPTLIWNSQTQSFLTKDFFAEEEKGLYAEHGTLYLNQILRDLTSHTRDFGRYIAEQLKPKGDFLKSKMFMFILIGGLILLAIIFLPKVIPQLQGFFDVGAGAISSVSENTASTAGGLVTPR